MNLPPQVRTHHTCQLHVRVFGKVLESRSVHENGLFVLSEEPGEIGQVVQLSVTLPNQDSLNALGVVRGIIETERATEARPAGMEIDFYRPSREDTQLWLQVHAAAARAGQTVGGSAAQKAAKRTKKAAEAKKRKRRKPWRPTGQFEAVGGPPDTHVGNTSTPGLEERRRPRRRKRTTTGGFKSLTGSHRVPSGGYPSARQPEATGDHHRVTTNPHHTVPPVRQPQQTTLDRQRYVSPHQEPLQFDVRMRTVRQLMHWVKTKLSTGSVFIATQDQVAIGTPLKVVIEHPVSHQGCGIIGHVETYGEDETGERAVIYIRFDYLDARQLKRLQAFAISGVAR